MSIEIDDPNKARQQQEMLRFKPDYSYYSKLDGLKLSEFVLILHEIDPKIYTSHALDHLFEGGVFKPESLYVPSCFMDALDAAHKDYTLLKRVEWSKKYDDYYRMMHGTFVIEVLVAEAIEKDLILPGEFLKLHNKGSVKIGKVNKQVKGSKASPSQESRSRNTFLKIIAAMARSGYGRKDLLTPIGFSQELEAETQGIGHPVSDATILNILKEANEYMELPGDES